MLASMTESVLSKHHPIAAKMSYCKTEPMIGSLVLCFCNSISMGRKAINVMIDATKLVPDLP